jgi:hypothetical protein
MAIQRDEVEKAVKKPRVSKTLPSMRKLADFIKDLMNTGIPGYPDIPILQWCERFGKGWISHSVIYQWINQKRLPNIDTLVLFGILLKESGADVGVFDPLLAAADGIFHEWQERFRQEGIDVDDAGDWSAFSDPEEAPLSLPANYAVEVYQGMSFADRKASMQGLLEAIARDIKYSQLNSEFDMIRGLVKEAVVRQGNHPERLAEWAEVPEEWIRLILDGRLEDAQKLSTTEYILKLSSKVKNLDGATDDTSIYACLLEKSEIKQFKKEVKRIAQQI